MSWVAFAGATGEVLRRRGVPPHLWPEALRAWISGLGPYGPAVYVLIFAVRPLTFVPATFMTVASGLIWGPLGGTLFTLVGENISAGVAFWAARLIGREWTKSLAGGVLSGLERRLSADAFRSVLILRLLFAPFDVVNFAAGLTGMSYAAFAAATFVGIVPGVICFVFLGSSWRDPRLLVFSGAVLALALGGAKLLRRPQESRVVPMSGLKGDG
ncbi:MAG: TVP38/TMEM64 family protein [Elusimicrobia bacterium]|nr:TVP38/TMEM64 family protein [Elusimicrobiota bacterium]